jgi:hypothetical protein
MATCLYSLVTNRFTARLYLTPRSRVLALTGNKTVTVYTIFPSMNLNAGVTVTDICEQTISENATAWDALITP